MKNNEVVGNAQPGSGYVVWHEQAAGTFLQIREEVNFIDNATMAKLKPEQLESAHARFRC